MSFLQQRKGDYIFHLGLKCSNCVVVVFSGLQSTTNEYIIAIRINSTEFLYDLASCLDEISWPCISCRDFV